MLSYVNKFFYSFQCDLKLCLLYFFLPNRDSSIQNMIGPHNVILLIHLHLKVQIHSFEPETNNESRHKKSTIDVTKGNTF